jgi:hypothetical protein
MRTATLSRTVRRMAEQVGRHCPECAGWPDEIILRVVEEVIEPGEPPLPPEPPARNPWDEPCPSCGRRHRPRVVAFEE